MIDADRRTHHRAVAVAASLTPLLDHITVVSNLELRNAYTTGNHASSNCAFLSCSRAKRTEGSDYELGTTVDQIAARAIGRDTPIPSLEIGTDLIAQVGNCDNGYACAYQNNLSWSSPTTPLPTEADPRVSSSGCSAMAAAERRKAELKKSGSILDWMTADMARLRRELGGDRIRVDQYLDSVREVERRIQRAEQSDAAALPDLDRPASVPVVWEDHVKLMFDLQVLALQADMTRVITFQLARETSTAPIRTSVSPSRITRCRTTPTIRKSWSSWQRSTRITCRCSRICSKGWRRRLTATVRCSITRCTARQRHGQSRYSHEPAHHRCRRPWRQASGRQAYQIREADAAGEPPSGTAGQGRRASRHVRGQHGSRVESGAAERMSVRLTPGRAG